MTFVRSLTQNTKRENPKIDNENGMYMLCLHVYSRNQWNSKEMGLYPFEKGGSENSHAPYVSCTILSISK